jgi:cobalt/nickel transport system ATP-binding protein
MPPFLVNLEDICFYYTPEWEILHNLSLSVHPGSRIGIIGDNGAGKTTLLHIIMGLKKPTAGKVELFGKPMQREKDFQGQRTRIGFVFQDADDQLFCPTVLEDVSFGPLNLGLSRDKSLQMARETLQRLNLDDLQDRLVHKLSGGQKKLVSLATVLAMRPEMLILDEPTGGLDRTYREKLIQTLQEIDMPHLIVSHDFDFLDRTSSEFFLLKKGRLLPGSASLLHSHSHVHPLGEISHEHGDRL